MRRQVYVDPFRCHVMHYYVKSISLSVEKRGVVLGGCALCWQFLWVLWGERNKKTFENVVGVEVEFLWQRVRFWDSLWASVALEV